MEWHCPLKKYKFDKKFSCAQAGKRINRMRITESNQNRKKKPTKK